MVDFDLSVVHFPNIAKRNNLVNEFSAYFLWPVVNTEHCLCILVCALVAASSHLLSLVVGLSNTPTLSIHWPMRSRDSSVTVRRMAVQVTLCVFVFLYGSPLAGNIYVDTLIAWLLRVTHFFMKNPVCVSFETRQATVSRACENNANFKKALIVHCGVRRKTGYCSQGRASEFGGWRTAVKWVLYSLSYGDRMELY